MTNNVAYIGKIHCSLFNCPLYPLSIGSSWRQPLLYLAWSVCVLGVACDYLGVWPVCV